MSVAELKRTGRESGLMLRARIEGCPIDFVTHPSMVSLTPVAGRTRRHGLSFQGQKITQKVDLAKCTVEASGWSLKITDHSEVAAVLFACEPEETWMTAGTLDDVGTTLVVASTTGFDASGYLWIDTECMSYTSLGTTVDADGVTRGTFEGLGRGALGTLAQYHYSASDASSGRNLRFPSVTNRPATFEGRRVELYAYGRGDDPQGDGTQFNLGIVLRDPRMSGAEWSISCDPISKALDAELGGDLGDCRPRGIHYPASRSAESGRFFLNVWREINPGPGPDTTAIPEINDDHFAGQIYLPHPDYNSGSGFFETQWSTTPSANVALSCTFFEAVQGQLDTLMSGWRATLTIVPTPDGESYHFRLDLPATYADAVVITNGSASETRWDVDPKFDPNLTTNSPALDLGDTETVLTPGQTYYLQAHPDSVAGAGTVPRGYIIPLSSTTPDAAATDHASIFLDGTIVPTADMTAVQIDHNDEVREYGTYAAGIDNVARSLPITGPAPERPGSLAGWIVYTSANLPTIKIGRRYEYDPSIPLGTYQVLKSIETDCPEYVNLGVMPVIRSGDWTGAAFGEWFAQYVAAPAVAAFRRYTSFRPQKLLDYITPDLQLLGAFLAFDTIGRLTIKRLRPVLATEVPALRITAFLKDSWPSYERSPFGSINTWVLQDGYDPIEDKSTGIPFVVRDVTAYGRNPTPRALSVKPKSVYYGPELTYEDAADAAQPVLSIYASPYVIVMGSVPLTALDAVLGSAVSVSTSLLPGSAGLRGMSAVGMVTSREIDLYGGTIELEILISLSGAVGYAPSALVTAQTDQGGGAWDITLSADYFRPGETAAHHFLEGDAIKVYPFDALPGVGAAYSGTVASGGVGNVVPVVLDGVAIDDATNLLAAPASVVWTGAGGGTVATGVADPLGGTDADTITDDGAAAFEYAQTATGAYVSGSAVACEVWLKKDAAALNFAEIRIGFDGIFANDGAEVRLDTGAAQTRVSAYTSIDVTEAVSGWWRVRFTHAGGVGTTVAMRIYAAMGLTSAFPSINSAAVGDATVYAPRIVYLAWTPGADEWVLAFDADGTTSANMKRYGWLADESLRIDFTTDPDRAAFKFSTSG